MQHSFSTVDNAEAKQQLEPFLEMLAGQGEANLVAAIRRLLNGERDEDVLCEPLTYRDAAIINAILHGIENKETIRRELQKFEPLIAGVVAAVDDAKVKQGIEPALEQLVKEPDFKNDFKNVIATIQRILDGERYEAELCEPLGYGEATIINAILRRIAGEI